MAVLLSVLSITLVLSTPVLSTLAEHSLDFNDPYSSLTYTYNSSYDFTDATIKVRLNLDLNFYFATSGDGFVEILKVESVANADGIFDVLSVELFGDGTKLLPPKIMVMLSSPLSSDSLDATSYCLMSYQFDYTDKVISIVKSGPNFNMSIEGFEDISNYYCQKYEVMREHGKGKIPISTVNIGPNLKGCTSLLSFPGVDMFNTDKTCPLDYITGDVTYLEGHCGSERSIACPTEPPPTEAHVPTPKKTTSIPEIATPKKETEPHVKETTQKTEPKKPTTEPKKQTTEPKKQTTEPKKPVTAKPKTKAPVNNTTEDDGDDDDYNVITDVEASTGSASSSVIIIICVVAAGIVVVVVLLYVGYRFHFRDKGSYKLEETKGEPNGEDFGNEYTDLNPTSKDQEWYL